MPWAYFLNVKFEANFSTFLHCVLTLGHTVPITSTWTVLYQHPSLSLYSELQPLFLDVLLWVHRASATGLWPLLQFSSSLSTEIQKKISYLLSNLPTYFCTHSCENLMSFSPHYSATCPCTSSQWSVPFFLLLFFLTASFTGPWYPLQPASYLSTMLQPRSLTFSLICGLLVHIAPATGLWFTLQSILLFIFHTTPARSH